MKLINRDTDYAVRALSYILRRKTNIVTVAELVAELGMPRPFLRKILQALNKNGFLKSRRGKGGGFILALAPRQIYLTDVMRVFQGPVRLNECSFKKRVCPETGACPLREKISGLERRMVSELMTVTLESL